MYDLVVIGSGPGGYIAAIRAAQLGMKVACVERYASYGGTCLNVGCIPSKALLESSERFVQAQHELGEHGVDVAGQIKLNLERMMARKQDVVAQSSRGVAQLFGKNKVDGILNGHGTIVSPNKVRVAHDDGKVTELDTKRILIATGSKPISLPSIVIDKKVIVDSTGAIAFDRVPNHLVIIGAGVIGLELGSVWARLGAKVTVLEYTNKILGRSDDDVAKEAQKLFTKQGLNFILGVKVTGATVEGDAAVVTYEDGDGKQHQLGADRVLVAIGRRPFTKNLGLEAVGIETDRGGRIPVDPHTFETKVPGIYAIGDVITGPMLAHKAEHEGVVCVEKMAGIGAHINYDAIPDVVYTEPEVSSVGKTERELKEAGVPFKVGKFPFKANGRARALGNMSGFVKIMAHAETDRILGAAIVGPRAGDLIAELAVVMEFGGSAEDVARSSHAHPTLAEAIKEAALAVDNRTLNF
jgi:dihydrolipoamide dehydrogenase